MMSEKMGERYGEEYFTCLHRDCKTKCEHAWFKYEKHDYEFGYPNAFTQYLQRVPGMNFFDKETIVDIATGVEKLNSLNGYYCNDVYAVSICKSCEKPTFWFDGKVIYPVTEADIPDPNMYMPVSVQELYLEARSVYHLSYKSAAALLRLALEHLLNDLGGVGKSNYKKIENLINQGTLSARVQKLLDTIRVLGNDGVHEGVINLADDKKSENIYQLFKALNYIVRETYETEAFVDDLYDNVPESKRIVK